MSDEGRVHSRGIRTSGQWSISSVPSKGTTERTYTRRALQPWRLGEWDGWKRQLREAMEKTSVQMGLFLLLTYVLFVNNIATIARASDVAMTRINVTLVVSFVLFCGEMAINFSTASKRDLLYNAMEVIGTLSILMEVSWVTDFLGLDYNIETENVSKTAIITSRAGKVAFSFVGTRFVS